MLYVDMIFPSTNCQLLHVSKPFFNNTSSRIETMADFVSFNIAPECVRIL